MFLEPTWETSSERYLQKKTIAPASELYLDQSKLLLYN